jgi:hypothetical protein
MDFSLNNEQKMIRDQLRKFVHEQILLLAIYCVV